MKKYYLFVGLLLGVSVGFAQEDMQFVTTLSAPIAVFDKVETTDASNYATAKKVTVGVFTRSGQGFNSNVVLKGKKARFNTLELSNNTQVSGSNSPVWKTPNITLRKGGNLSGKQLLTNNLNFTSTGVHTVYADNTIQVAKDVNLATAKAENSLIVGSKKWYETVEKPSNGGNAQWGSICSGNANVETSNVLFFSEDNTDTCSGSGSGSGCTYGYYYTAAPSVDRWYYNASACSSYNNCVHAYSANTSSSYENSKLNACKNIGGSTCTRGQGATAGSACQDLTSSNSAVQPATTNAIFAQSEIATLLGGTLTCSSNLSGKYKWRVNGNKCEAYVCQYACR